MTLEVRCCCQPQKLVGWLDLPLHLVTPGHVSVAIRSSAPGFELTERLELEVAYIETPPGLATLDEPLGERYLCIKAEDIPVATLERIKGFVAA